MKNSGDFRDLVPEPLPIDPGEVLAAGKKAARHRQRVAVGIGTVVAVLAGAFFVPQLMRPDAEPAATPSMSSTPTTTPGTCPSTYRITTKPYPTMGDRMVSVYWKGNIYTEAGVAGEPSTGVAGTVICILPSVNQGEAITEPWPDGTAYGLKIGTKLYRSKQLPNSDCVLVAMGMEGRWLQLIPHGRSDC